MKLMRELLTSTRLTESAGGKCFMLTIWTEGINNADDVTDCISLYASVSKLVDALIKKTPLDDFDAEQKKEMREVKTLDELGELIEKFYGDNEDALDNFWSHVQFGEETIE